MAQRTKSEWSRSADVAADIWRERNRQRVEEDWSVERDDTHSVADWIALLARYTGRAGDEAEAGDVARYRRRLIQVGAIAVAAIESLDRAMELKQPSA